jgi:hypothetical protein
VPSRGGDDHDDAEDVDAEAGEQLLLRGHGRATFLSN